MEISEILKNKDPSQFTLMKREPEGLEPLALELSEYLGNGLAWSIVRNNKYPIQAIKDSLDAYRKNPLGKKWFFGILRNKAGIKKKQ